MGEFLLYFENNFNLTDGFECAIQLGNVYKMSRNKDRYESSNNRRQQIFMSQEDVAAGRKSNWTGVEITGMLFSKFNSTKQSQL